MPGFKLDNGSSGSVDTIQYYTVYTWKVDFKGIPGYESLDRKDSLVYLKDATLPNMSISKEIVPGANLEYKFAKMVSWDDVTLTWYDNHGLLSIIKSWRESVWTPEAGLRTPDKYKITTSIFCYTDADPAGDYNSGASDSGFTQQYKLIGCWPSSIKHGNLTYTNSDIKIIELTLTYDWAEVSIM